MEIMIRGGNAVDAAVAMAWATGVLMPDMCGPGGEAFCLIRQNEEPVRAYLGSGPLPAGFSLEDLPPDSLVLPLRGGASVSVPGAVDLYYQIHQRYGRLSWPDVMGPAVRLAEQGFPVDTRLYQSLDEYQRVIQDNPAVRRRFYPDGRPLKVGQTLIQPELAETLKTIRQYGPDPFYAGAIAERVSAAVIEAGGYLTARDLSGYETEIADPVHVRFQDFEVYQTPLPSAGVVMLEALKILQDDPWSADWREQPELVHRMIEALRLAFRDRRGLLGDPRFHAVDPATLLSDAWIDERRQMIGHHALSIPTHLTAGDTTSFVAIDESGLHVSFIHSLALAFGSGVYVPDTGFFLNNRSGRSFNRIPGHPNEARPGKRPMHTLNTWLVTRKNQTVLLGNTPGGDGQPQWNLSVLLDLLAGGRTPGEAVALPRLQVAPATDAHTLHEPSRVLLESRFSPQVAEELQRRGHDIQVIGPWDSGGTVQVIQVMDGVFQGASDPRGIGQTQGY